MMIRSKTHRAHQDLDAEINVVPFIDLLSCCIAFLMVVSVWSSYGFIPTESLDVKKIKPWKGPTSSTSSPSSFNDKVLTLHLKTNSDIELVSSVVFKNKRLISSQSKTFNLIEIKEALQYYIEHADKMPHVVITTDDQVTYSNFMQILAVCQSSSFKSLGLSLENFDALETQGIRFK